MIRANVIRTRDQDGTYWTAEILSPDGSEVLRSADFPLTPAGRRQALDLAQCLVADYRGALDKMISLQQDVARYEEAIGELAAVTPRQEPSFDDPIGALQAAIRITDTARRILFRLRP